MGDIADAMINGDMDCMTGEWLGDGAGYPRTYEPGHPNSVHKKKHKLLFSNSKNNTKELNGIGKFLVMNGITHNDKAIKIVRDYCKDELHFAGTLKECAEEIQKDFGKFVNYVKQLNN